MGAVGHLAERCDDKQWYAQVFDNRQDEISNKLDEVIQCFIPREALHWLW